MEVTIFARLCDMNTAFEKTIEPLKAVEHSEYADPQTTVKFRMMAEELGAGINRMVTQRLRDTILCLRSYQRSLLLIWSGSSITKQEILVIT
jgi:hypothetical protein